MLFLITELVIMDRVFQSINGSFGVQKVLCAGGLQLLSCGYWAGGKDPVRYVVPMDSTYCECSNTVKMNCSSSCTNAVSGFEIQKSTALTGNFSVSCSAGKKVITSSFFR